MATIGTAAAEAVGFYGLGGVTLPRESAGESASQTFKLGNFVIADGGYVSIIASDNDGDALGIATKAGGNGTADADVTAEYIPMIPGLLVEMNLLEAADANHTSVATDLWTKIQWQTTSDHHVLSTASTTDRFFVVKLGLGQTGDQYGKGGVGDINIRVLAVPLGSMCASDPDV